MTPNKTPEEAADTINIVFDFGAVLFTWKPVDLVAECFPQQAPTVAVAGHLAHAVFGHADWQAFDRGVLSMQAVVERTSVRLQLPHMALADLVQSIGARLLPVPESLALLEQLRDLRERPDGKLRLYYLSNMPIPYARALQGRYPFLEWFDGGIFSGDVQHIKPEPAIYQLLTSRYGLVPGRTVLIDDLLGNVAAAQTLGWHGIHFRSAAQTKQTLQAMGLRKIGR